MIVTTDFALLENHFNYFSGVEAKDCFEHGIEHSVIPLLPNSTSDYLHVVILEDKVLPRGYLYLTISTFNNETIVSLEYIYTHPQGRCRGVASNLIEKAAAFLKKNEVDCKNFTYEPTSPAGQKCAEKLESLIA